MAQVHSQVLSIGDTTFCLVRCGTGDNGMSLNTMFKIVRGINFRGKILSFVTESEYNILLTECKNFPDAWKGYVGAIAFALNNVSGSKYGDAKYIFWYRKGKGRRWREGSGYLHDVIANPGCIMCYKKKQ